MQLILFIIRGQWIGNLLQKPFDENPLASKLRMLLIYRSKAKKLMAYILPFFLHAPCYSDTINRKPEKYLYILQCDGDLTIWHVEGVSLGPPAMVNLSTRGPEESLQTTCLNDVNDSVIHHWLSIGELFITATAGKGP